MKKRNKLTLLMIFAAMITIFITACETKKTITMEQVASANSIENLLKKYESVSRTFISGKTPVESQYYIDSVLTYAKQPESEKLLSENGIYKVENGVSSVLFNIDKKLNPEDQFKKLYFLDKKILDDKITGISEEDEMLILNTKLSPEDSAEFCLDTDVTCGPEDYVTVEYSLDPRTYELLFYTAVLHKEDGTDNIIEEAVSAYNEARPEEAQVLYEAASSGDKRTITLIADADTLNPVRHIMEIPKGSKVSFILPMVYRDLYTDENYTEFFQEETDLSSDLTLYTKSYTAGGC